jgi:hypothetical protein
VLLLLLLLVKLLNSTAYLLAAVPQRLCSLILCQWQPHQCSTARRHCNTIFLLLLLRLLHTSTPPTRWLLCAVLPNPLPAAPVQHFQPDTALPQYLDTSANVDCALPTPLLLLLLLVLLLLHDSTPPTR